MTITVWIKHTSSNKSFSTYWLNSLSLSLSHTHTHTLHLQLKEVIFCRKNMFIQYNTQHHSKLLYSYTCNNKYSQYIVNQYQHSHNFIQNTIQKPANATKHAASFLPTLSQNKLFGKTSPHKKVMLIKSVSTCVPKTQYMNNSLHIKSSWTFSSEIVWVNQGDQMRSRFFAD